MQHHFTVKLIESVGEREREIKREQFHVICWEASLMCRRSVSSCLSRAVSQPRITTLNKHDYQLILQRSHKHEQMTLITSAGQEDTAAAVSQQHLSGFVMLDWNNNLLSLSPPPSSTPEKVGIQAKRKQTMKNDNNNGDRRGWKWERARGSKQYAASWRCKTFTALPLLISCGVLQFFIPLITHVNITLAVVQYSFEWWCNSERNNSRGSAGTDVYSGCLGAVNIPHVSYWLPCALYEKSILNKLVICWTGQDLGLCE